MIILPEEAYEHPIDLVSILFDCISPDRYQKKDDWMKIGEDCIRTLRKDDEGKTIWKNKTEDYIQELQDRDGEDVVLPHHLNNVDMEIEAVDIRIKNTNTTEGPTYISPSLIKIDKTRSIHTCNTFAQFADYDNPKKLKHWKSILLYENMCFKFIDMISNDRFRSNSDWISIGKVFFKIKTTGLERWCKATTIAYADYKRIPQFFIDKCDIVFSKEVDKLQVEINKLSSTCSTDVVLLTNSTSSNTLYKLMDMSVSEAYFNKQITRLLKYAAKHKISLTTLIKQYYYSKYERIMVICSQEFKGFKSKKKENYLTNKTLGWFAHCDNSGHYQKWLNNRLSIAINNSLTAYDSDIAAAFHVAYWMDFCYDESIKKWYTFDNGIWEEGNTNISLRTRLQKDFKEEYIKELDILNDEMHYLKIQKDNANEEDLDNINYNIDEITALIKQYKVILSILSSTAGQLRIISQIEIFFVDKKFSTYINSNISYFSAANGVIEMNNDTIEFRDRKPEDFITFSGPVDYNNEYSLDHPDIIFLFDWFNKCFRDEDTLRYFILFCAACLHGRNIEKIFAVWTGHTNNGKTTISDLFYNTFGDRYSTKMSAIELTGIKQRTGSGANPELDRTKASYSVFVTEPESEVMLSAAVIKRYTGCDRVACRGLYQNSTEFDINFRLVMLANGIPPIDVLDQAIKLRTHILPFDSTWVINKAQVPETEEEQMTTGIFLQDPSFSSKVKELAEPFLWLLVHHYPIYKREGLRESQKMIDAGVEYWHNLDIYVNYISENLIEITEDDPVLTIQAAYDNFCSWKYGIRSNKRIVNKIKLPTFVNNMTSHLVIKGDIIIGKTIRHID